MGTEKTNISEYLPEVAEKFPDRKAVIFRQESLNYRELEQISSFYASEFRNAGIKRGTKVLVMLKPGIEFIASVFAVFKTGAVPVLIDPGMGVKNLLKCIKETEPEAMIGIDKAHWIRMLYPTTFKSLKTSFSFGPKSPPWLKKLPDFSSVLNYDKKDLIFQIEKTDLDECAAIVFTTGSTGPPKGVVYTHGIYIAQTEIIRDVYGAGPEHVDMPAFPLFALFSVALGMPCVIPDINPSLPAKADPALIVRTIEDHNVSFSFASPALWGRVCYYCIKNNIKLESLKNVLMAGAPVRPELHEALSRIISEKGDTFVPYGATESLPVANFCGSQLTEEKRQKIMNGAGYCVGKPLPGIKISIIEPMDGPIEKISDIKEVECGESGEIIVDGRIVTPEYYNLPEHTAMGKIKKDDCSVVHRMGDIGYFDSDGYLWFKGRKSHRIFTHSGILYPVCCEAIFNQHPKVFRSALIGVGPRNNQTPIIIIQPVPRTLPLYGDKRAQFIEELKELGAQHPHTADIKHFLFHNDFPVDIRHNAKIFREKLSGWAEKFNVSDLESK